MMLSIANQNSAGLRIKHWCKAEINRGGNRMRRHTGGATRGLGLRSVSRIGRVHVNYLHKSEYGHYHHKEQCGPFMDPTVEVLAVLFHIPKHAKYLQLLKSVSQQVERHVM